ncbi:threo-3-hydroxy-L-aspartate ammonia-lyase [Alcaligenes endophyticus]|uniref:Threo-3-hydroxy-L-aspartate ammonia-lyase n=1 Tax=Alcaligenes endophyticus TaxID=1929088 RepID=A0ABT8EH34_9BURK|nr:threo-3-hydroxy-L-aspartate ammonia-lyase [Alcaligenes endophyticus]MCX5589736.1 threo-3-hydroxy-L-aspartate ammonia-lyase [Alcaligenes endophyticus]MDN4120600.1 threo-3-hydroxy-L-aspartate ammonia-lyase [Alcaligenes endophyticus]
MSTSDQASYEDVLMAAHTLRNVVLRTPVLSSRSLNEQYDAQFFFKCENFQRIGAFKFRGGFNALAQLSDEQRKAGVLAYSSGNHAQAVALAARLLGVQATIVMNSDAPAAKKQATLAYGAEVVEYDRLRQDRMQIANQLVAERGLTLIPPFGHKHVLAGQGTAAKELFEEVPDLDELYVPLGGGGLLSGCLLAASSLQPACKVYGVEPEAANDAQQSLRQGHIVQIAPPSSIADGALTVSLAPITFDIIRQYVHAILTVSDEQLLERQRFFLERMKMLVEPTGCLGAAAAIAQPERKGKRIGVLISGGNIDLHTLASYISGPLGAR